LNARKALLGLFVALTIAFASTTVYESGIRTTVTSTITSTSTAISVSTTTSTTTQTITVASTFDLPKALHDAYLSHIGAIDSRNATALAAQYETNATWMGAVPGGVRDSIVGITNITRFYEEAPVNNSQAVSCLLCLAFKAPFAVANETYSTTVSNDDKTGNVMSHLVFYGNTSIESGCYFPNIGPCKASIYIMGFDISYVLQGDRWLISTESLTYFNSYGCLTLTLSPDGSVLRCTGI
jgi:hypothetical protein